MLAGRYPFRAGDVIRVSGRASVTTKTELFGRVQYEDGSKDRFEVLITHAGDRANQLFRTPDQFLQNGFIEALTVDTGIIKRGEYYMMVAVERLQHHYPVAASYIGVPHSPLGFFEHPISGDGLTFFETIADDIAGDVTTTHALAALNAHRKVYGLVWYYHASSDVATRILSIEIRHPWGALPTGGSVGVIDPIYKFTGPTLDQNQEGGMFFYNPGRGDGLLTLNDNGTISRQSTNTAPQPFPFIVRGDDPMTILLGTADGHANDRYSAYALVEEWISP